jgi:hypothetical protein
MAAFHAATVHRIGSLADQSQVFTVSLDGQVLGSQPISGDAPYLMHWIKMGNGGWAGGHMWGWIQFETTERHWLDPRSTYTNQGTFSSGAATHLRDS